MSDGVHEPVDINRVASALSSYVEFRRRHDQRHGAVRVSVQADGSSKELPLQVESLKKKLVLRNRYISTLRDFIANELVAAAAGGDSCWHSVAQMGRDEEARLMQLQDTVAEMRGEASALERELEASKGRLQAERGKRLDEAKRSEQARISLSERIAAVEAANKDLSAAASKYMSLYEREVARADGLEPRVLSLGSRAEALDELLAASDKNLQIHMRRSEELAAELLRFGEAEASAKDAFCRLVTDEQQALSRTVPREEHERLRAMYDRLAARVQQLTEGEANPAEGKKGGRRGPREPGKSKSNAAVDSKEVAASTLKFMMNQLRAELAKSKEQSLEQYEKIKALQTSEGALRQEVVSLRDSLEGKEAELRGAAAALAAMGRRERRVSDALQLVKTRPQRTQASQTSDAPRKDAQSSTDPQVPAAATSSKPRAVSRATQTPGDCLKASRDGAPRGPPRAAPREEPPLTHYRMQPLPPAAGSCVEPLDENCLSIVQVDSGLPAHLPSSRVAEGSSPSHPHRRLVSRSRSPQRAASPGPALRVTVTPLTAPEAPMHRPVTSSRGRRAPPMALPAANLFTNNRGAALEKACEGAAGRPLTVHSRKIVPTIEKD